MLETEHLFAVFGGLLVLNLPVLDQLVYGLLVVAMLVTAGRGTAPAPRDRALPAPPR